MPDITLALRPRLEELRVVSRVGQHRHACVVLRRGAQERDPTNVDLLDRVCKRAVRLGDCGCERVEVADDDGDGCDALCFEIRVIRLNRTRKDA